MAKTPVGFSDPKKDHGHLRTTSSEFVESIRKATKWLKGKALLSKKGKKQSSIDKGKMLVLDDFPIPDGKRRVTRLDMEKGMTALKITVRIKEEIKPQRIVKPPADVEKEHWFLNNYMKGKTLVAQRPATLTRTQKWRAQRNKSVRRMKQNLEMLAEAKKLDGAETQSPKLAEILEIAFGQPKEETTTEGDKQA